MTYILACHGSFYVQSHCAKDMTSEFLTIKLLIPGCLLYASRMFK